VRHARSIQSPPAPPSPAPQIGAVNVPDTLTRRFTSFAQNAPAICVVLTLVIPATPSLNLVGSL
jgi:hypothetical protein